MIILYRDKESATGDEIQTALTELVVAHRVEMVTQTTPVPGATLPLIVDGERTVSGRPALDAYLHELAGLLAEWRKYQSDACYVSDDGSAC